MKRLSTPGQRSVARGSVASRPWHNDELKGLANLADVLALSPQLRDVLGPNIDASVRVSASGEGIVFTFEKAQR